MPKFPFHSIDGSCVKPLLHAEPHCSMKFQLPCIDGSRLVRLKHAAPHNSVQSNFGPQITVHCHTQGRSKDFLLGGADLVRGPIPRVPPKTKNSSDLAHSFLEGAQILLQKNEYAAWGPLLRPIGPWFVTWAPDSSYGALVPQYGMDWINPLDS